MNILTLLLFEESLENNNRQLIRLRSDEMDMLPFTMSLINDFLAIHEKYKNLPVSKFLYAIHVIRPGSPIPLTRGKDEMTPSDYYTWDLDDHEYDDTPEIPESGDILEFMRGRVADARGFDDDGNVKAVYGSKLSLARSILGKVDRMKLGSVHEGLFFDSENVDVPETVLSLNQLTYEEFSYIPLFMKSLHPVEGRSDVLELNPSEFNKFAGQNASSILQKYMTVGLLHSQGYVQSSYLDEIRRFADHALSYISSMVTGASTRLELDSADANRRVQDYENLIKVGHNYIPFDLLGYVIDIVNKEISSRGFPEIETLYNREDFRSTLAGALYVATIIKQASYHMRDMLKGISENRLKKPIIPPVAFKQKKSVLRYFEPDNIGRILNSRPTHPMVSVFKKFRLPKEYT